MPKNLRHAVVHYGTARMNFENRTHLTTHFRDRDGIEVQVRLSKAPGIKFGFMDDDSHVRVFRVQDVTLENAVVVDWRKIRPDRPTPGPNGQRISEQAAARLLRMAIAENLEQQASLSPYEGLIRPEARLK